MYIYYVDKDKYLVVRVALLIVIILSLLSIIFSQLGEILVEKVYISLIFTFLYLLLELRIRELRLLPESLAGTLPEPISKRVIDDFKKLPNMKFIDNEELYNTSIDILENAINVITVSRHKPMSAYYISKIIETLKKRRSELTICRINQFDLSFIVWLVEQATLTQSNYNMKYYLINYPTIGMTVGKGGGIEKAIFILGKLDEFSPSSAICIYGDKVAGLKTINDWKDFAEDIKGRAKRIRNVEELNDYIKEELSQNPDIIKYVDEDIIKNELDILNKMGEEEYVNEVKNNLETVLNQNEELYKKFLQFNINVK